MNAVLKHWNCLSEVEAAEEILPCCGSYAWAAEMAARRPIASRAALEVIADAVWLGLPESAWKEAFASHRRMGQREAGGAATGRATEISLAWSKEEQSAVSPEESVHAALEEGNRRYEAKFGRTFLMRASGRSAEEILTLLEQRLGYDVKVELHETAEQQRQIMQLRLKRWLEAK
jgi:2-oxo-4-hydroxy-4-carboxy-5-ureidoimidazoline decarboxylase